MKNIRSKQHCETDMNWSRIWFCVCWNAALKSTNDCSKKTFSFEITSILSEYWRTKTASSVDNYFLECTWRLGEEYVHANGSSVVYGWFFRKLSKEKEDCRPIDCLMQWLIHYWLLCEQLINSSPQLLLKQTPDSDVLNRVMMNGARVAIKSFSSNVEKRSVADCLLAAYTTALITSSRLANSEWYSLGVCLSAKEGQPDDAVTARTWPTFLSFKLW